MDRREEESGGEAERHGRLKHTFASQFNPIQLLCFRKVLILRGHFWCCYNQLHSFSFRLLTRFVNMAAGICSRSITRALVRSGEV